MVAARDLGRARPPASPRPDRAPRPAHDPAPRSAPPATQALPTAPASVGPSPVLLRALGDAKLGGRGNGPVRTALAQSVQQTAGNRAARRLLARRRPADRPLGSPLPAPAAPSGLTPVARAESETGQVNAAVYTEALSTMIRDALQEEMSQVRLPIQAPGATWLDSSGHEFVNQAMAPIYTAGPLWPQLNMTLETPEPLVNRGRGAGEDGQGPLAYNRGVAVELRGRYSAALFHSLGRVLPAYLAARNRALQAAEDQQHMNLAKAPEPAVGDVPHAAPGAFAGSTLDTYVLNALRKDTVRFAALSYRETKPEAAPPPNIVALGSADDQTVLEDARRFQPTGATKDEIARWMFVTASNLDTAIADAAVFDSADMLQGIKARILDRRKRLLDNPDPAAVAAWDAQAAGQNELVDKAGHGLHAAAQQFRGMHKEGAEPPPPTVVNPLRAVASAYTIAVMTSERISEGQAWLRQADEKAQTYPIEVAEAMLQITRQRLAGLGGSQAAADPEWSGHVALALEQRSDDLRKRIVQVRETMLSDPTAAGTTLAEIQEQMPNLGGEITAVAYVEMVSATEHQLRDTLQSFVGAFTGKNIRYDNLSHELYSKWHVRWFNIYSLFEKRQYRAAQAALQAAGQEKDKLIEALQGAQETIKKEEKAESAIKFIGHLVIMVGIAVVTAGVGEAVGLALEGAGWATGGLATTAVVSGAEALTMTALSIPLMDDPSISGVLTQFFENWALGALVRGLGGMYRNAIAEEGKTLVGKASATMFDFATAVAGSVAIRAAEKKAHGQEMSAAEVESIVHENVVGLIVSAVAGRLSKRFLEEHVYSERIAELREAPDYKDLFPSADELRKATLQKAQTVRLTKNIRQAEELLRMEAETLRKEQQILEEIKRRAAKPDSTVKLSITERNQLTGDLQQNQAAQANVRRQAAMLRLKEIGVNQFEAPENVKLADFASELGHPEAPIQHAADGSEFIQITGENGEVVLIRAHAGTGPGPAARPLEERVPSPPENAGEPGKAPPENAGEPGKAPPAGEGRGYDDPYSRLQAKHKLSDEAATALRRAAVEPAVAERLLQSKVPSDELALYAMYYGARGVDAIDIISRKTGMKPQAAEKILARAREIDAKHHLDVLDQLIDLVPRLENPSALNRMLKEMEIELNQGVLGKLQEFTDAATRARAQEEGKQINLGTYGDVYDPTAGETVQHKNLRTADPGSVRQEMQGAANQLMGRGSKNVTDKPQVTNREKPPEGSLRVVEVQLRYSGQGPRNELLTADGPQLSDFVRETFADRPGEVDRVIFTNELGTFTFDGPQFYAPKEEFILPVGEAKITGPDGEVIDLILPDTPEAPVARPTAEPTEAQPPGPEKSGAEQQVDPELSAKEQTADGLHETYEDPEGFKMCSADCGQMREKFADILDENPGLKAQLRRFEKMPPPPGKKGTPAQIKAKKAARARIYKQLQETRMEKMVQVAEEIAEVDATFRELIDEATSNKDFDFAHELRFQRYMEKIRVRGRRPQSEVTVAEFLEVLERTAESRLRGSRNEEATLKAAKLEKNTKLIGEGDRIPDAITDKNYVDVKAKEDGVLYYTDQLEAFKTAGAKLPKGKKLGLAVVLTGKRASYARGTPKVRPSGPLVEATNGAVLHRNSETGEWMKWDAKMRDGGGGWRSITPAKAREILGAGVD